MNETGIMWTSKSIYVDIDTGNMITEKLAKKHYIIIKTDKRVNINERKTKGHIEYTKQCRRNPQRSFNFNT